MPYFLSGYDENEPVFLSKQKNIFKTEAKLRFANTSENTTKSSSINCNTKK